MKREGLRIPTESQLSRHYFGCRKQCSRYSEMQICLYKVLQQRDPTCTLVPPWLPVNLMLQMLANPATEVGASQRAKHVGYTVLDYQPENVGKHTDVRPWRPVHHSQNVGVFSHVFRLVIENCISQPSYFSDMLLQVAASNFVHAVFFRNIIVPAVLAALIV